MTFKKMTTFTDQMGRMITLGKTPKRIVSIVPSQTELLFDLGLRDEVVGITKFCIHPEEMFRTKPRVGGTKKLDLEKIRALQPDLIIGNKEENQREQVEELMKEFPVWMSDIYTLGDSLGMIRSVGELTNTQQRASEIINTIQKAFDQLKNDLSSPLRACPEGPKESGAGGEVSPLRTSNSKLKVAYFIWKDPYMIAGSNTFIDHLLHVCGFKNAFRDIVRYPTVTEDNICNASPDLIFLSSEPYPFKEKHVEAFRALSPSAKIMIVDGEMFSWYGSRLQHAPAYFSSLIKEIAPA